MQEICCEGQSCDHQGSAHDAACNQGGIDRSFHFAVFFCPEKPGSYNRTAHIAAKRKSYKNQGHFIAVAHCGEGVLTCEFPGNEAVCKIIQLLKNDAAE